MDGGKLSQDDSLSRSLSMPHKKMTFFILPEEDADVGVTARGVPPSPASYQASLKNAENDEKMTKKLRTMESEMAALVKENNALKTSADTKVRVDGEDATARTTRIASLERELARSQGIVDHHTLSSYPVITT